MTMLPTTPSLDGEGRIDQRDAPPLDPPVAPSDDELEDLPFESPELASGGFLPHLGDEV